MSIPLTDESDTLLPIVNPEYAVELVKAQNKPRKNRQGKSKLAATMFTSKSEVHLTPEKVLVRVLALFNGVIDLDPAAESETSHTGAKLAYTVAINGLIQRWFGKVFCNPPYGRGVHLWAEKFKKEYLEGDVEQGLFLVAGRIDTKMAKIMGCFMECQVDGRLKFLNAKGEEQDPAPFPSVIYYLGHDIEGFVREFSQIGRIKFPEMLYIARKGKNPLMLALNVSIPAGIKAALEAPDA